MKRPSWNLMIILILSLAVVLPCGTGYAASSALVLGDILKRTESYYQQAQAFTAEFRQATKSSAASSIATTEASGRLYYAKPRQMRWEYERPEPQVFVANQHLAWLYVPSDRQMSLFDANTLFASPLAQMFFDGVIELKNNFDVSIDSKRSTTDAAILKLVPKKEDPNIKLLHLTIELKTYRISAIETLDTLGNTNRISLDSQSAAPQLDAKLFQLEIPPSTVVLDTEGRELTPSDIDSLKRKLPAK